MSERKPTAGADPTAAEPFLERWSRKKTQARTGTDEESAAPADLPVQASEPEPSSRDPGVVELPDLDSLDADSDYSAFLTPGVDAKLRRTALRKLFSSPKFNVLDGMDDYCDDYTQFESLGDLVTADMRHHIERIARAAAKALEDGGPGEVPATDAAPNAQAVAASSGEPADQAANDQKGPNDESDRPA